MNKKKSVKPWRNLFIFSRTNDVKDRHYNTHTHNNIKNRKIKSSLLPELEIEFIVAKIL
jgi:hypothetical protein